MNIEFQPLNCPMCGEELLYSEGTHDLCCALNKPELLNALSDDQAHSEKKSEQLRALHELRAGYGKSELVSDNLNSVGNNSDETDKDSGCVFALSFTESARHGTLWSIRTVHGRTNYFSLMRLLDKIEKRQRRGERLASNVPNPPRKVERSKECKLAFRYSLEIEDLYSIKYSSETVDKLAHYYGLTEPDIKHIQAANLSED